MVKIRLQRYGTKKKPFYRVVVADSRMPRDGRFLEILGTYNPVSPKKELFLENERVSHWLKCGAQPTDTMKPLLLREGLITSQKFPVKEATKNKKVASQKKAS